jgi:hypothetical protein
MSQTCYYINISRSKEHNMEYQTVEVVVRVNIKADADYAEVISEMDYSMIHPDILSTEIVDINSEI